MRYRQATPADVPALALLNHALIRDEGLCNAMSPSELETRMRAWLVGEYEAVLFEEDSRPVGYALFRRETDYFYLRQFFICPEHRRQGRGRAALDWLCTYRWQDLSRVRLDVLVGNAVGQAFWRSVGFQDYCLTMEWRR